MRTSRQIASIILAWVLVPIPLSAQEAPSNHAVLLPPQALDGPGKTANNMRERYGQWSISAGVFFLQPIFETNPAFVVKTPGGNTASQVAFGNRFDVSPNIWLGYVSERGWGARARWFQFDHDANASYAAAPGQSVAGVSTLGLGNANVAGMALANSNLAVNVADFQATRTWERGNWTHLAGLGVRYTHLSQEYQATIADAVTRIDLSSSHNLNAAGPSFSLQTRRRVGESGFTIYGQLHGAVLFGDANEAYWGINNGIVQQSFRRHGDVLPVGELELGGEYQRSVGRANLFLQAGFVGQVWWGGGNATNLDAIGPSSASNSNFGFLGLALRAGVRY